MKMIYIEIKESCHIRCLPLMTDQRSRQSKGQTRCNKNSKIQFSAANYIWQASDTIKRLQLLIKV